MLRHSIHSAFAELLSTFGVTHGKKSSRLLEELVLQEKAAMDEQCQKQVANIQASKEKAKQLTEAKVATILDRVQGMAEKQTVTEQQRGVLNQALDM